jgi:CheY-like chemotaxis protein
MSEEVLKSAFEPFFTTKEIELGRGLGLPTVRKVASDHGGTVRLSSRAGVGTTLRIVLPVSERADHSDEDSLIRTRSGQPSMDPEKPSTIKRTLDEHRVEQVNTTQRHVLVVESDEGLGRAIVRSLRRAGYAVVWVANAEQAASAFGPEAGQFDLVLLDLDMSDAAGQRARTLIRKQNPSIPLVLLSAVDEEQNGAMPSDRETVVRKPVDTAVLARVVQLALRRAGRGSRP